MCRNFFGTLIGVCWNKNKWLFMCNLFVCIMCAQTRRENQLEYCHLVCSRKIKSLGFIKCKWKKLQLEVCSRYSGITWSLNVWSWTRSVFNFDVEDFFDITINSTQYDYVIYVLRWKFIRKIKFICKQNNSLFQIQGGKKVITPLENAITFANGVKCPFGFDIFSTWWNKFYSNGLNKDISKTQPNFFIKK